MSTDSGLERSSNRMPIAGLKAQVRAEVDQVIKLVRRIKTIDKDRCLEPNQNQTVFWTWGDAFKQGDFAPGKT